MRVSSLFSWNETASQLEDLATLEPVDQTHGATVDAARLAIRALAGMHSRWWRSPILDDCEWMPRIDDVEERDLTTEIYSCGWEPFLDRFGDALSDHQMRLGARIRDLFPSVISHLGSGPTTLDRQIGAPLNASSSRFTTAS